MRAVVVGGGFVGRALARAAAAAGDDVTLVSRSPLAEHARRGLDDVTTVVGDVADRGVTEALVGPDVHVFHCAGTAVPVQVEADPAGDLASSLPPLLRVLTGLRSHANTGITFVSSGGTVYGQPHHLPIAEDHPTRPITATGINKLAAEHYVRLHAERAGNIARVRVIRCANAYGPEQRAGRGQGVIASLVDAAARTRPVVIYGDGSQVRDYVHVDDVARAAIALARRPERELIVNVGSGAGTSVNELVAIVERVAGRALERAFEPARPFDLPAVVLDNTRLRSLVPSFSARSVDDGLAELWRVHRATALVT